MDRGYQKAFFAFGLWSTKHEKHHEIGAEVLKELSPVTRLDALLRF